MFRRLVVRKENETPLDRFSGDYEELMTYANFRDLADIIVGNEMLEDRLTILEPRDGASLLDRLHELEEMRRALAANASVSAETEANLQSYFEEFRSAIKRGKPQHEEPTSPTREMPKPQPPPDGDDETLDSIFGDDDAPAAKPASRPGRLVVKVSADSLRGGGRAARSEVEPMSDAQQEPRPARLDRSVADEMGSMETPVTEVSSRPRGGGDEPAGLIDELENVERALRDGDDATILKALHVEVTEIADGMLRRDPKQGHLVWQLAGRHGWFEKRRNEYGLQPLQDFYRLADEFLEAYSSGAKTSQLKSMLADAEFSRMLLAMREAFMTSRGRA